MQKLKESNFIITDKDYDLGIAIGGDGSFLRMIKAANFNSQVYYIGINTGTLGFAQEVRADQLDLFIDKLNNNNYQIKEIGVQETKVEHGKNTSTFCSLNEITIRDSELNTTILDINVNDSLLERFVGDGILISTSFGSTAYNLSFGGSIIFNDIHTLQITSIAPLNNRVYHALTNSIIIPENKTITIIPSKEKRNLIISIDGENKFYDDVKVIETFITSKRIKCLREPDYDFVKKVHEKFLEQL